MTFVRSALRLISSLPGRIVVTTVLLAVVAASIDWDTLRETLADASWGWFALACALVLVALAIGAIRWHRLVAAADVESTGRQSVRAYAIGAFTNNVLPTGFGGDVVRGWIVGRSGKPLARALTSVGVDRVTALACLLLLGWVGVAAEPDAITGSLVALLGASSLALALAAVVLWLLLRRPRTGRFVPAWIRPWAGEVAGVLRRYAGDRRLLVSVLVLGIAFQAVMVGASWAISESLGLDLGPAVLAVVTPLVLIATVAPISVAGFGVREGAFVVLLGEVGVSSADATLFSLLSVAAMAIASLPGGIALVVSGERPTRPVASGR